MSKIGATAYAQTAKTGQSNRELEATLLINAANRLHAVQRNWDKDRSDLDGALTYNRKLWTVLSVAATDKDNPLPDDVKRNMALIAMFVFNRSLDLISDQRKENLEPLIEINRNIAVGLMANPETTQAPAA